MTETKSIWFAGGCFWGTEHFFKGVDGVLKATAGYANGHLDRQPSYEEVYTDTTGFAETVERGEIPPQIKRGVLSEDGLYNLLNGLNA